MDILTAARQGLVKYSDETWTCKNCQGHERYVLGNYCCVCHTGRMKRKREKLRNILKHARRNVKTVAKS